MTAKLVLPDPSWIHTPDNLSVVEYAMAVDDAELLALAGGDSSDDDAPQQQNKKSKAVSPLPSIEISRADSDKFAATHGKSAARGSRGIASKAAKKARKDDSEEEGEA